MPHVSLDDLIHAARSGDRLVSFPTDTVPALASRPDRAHLIYAAKQRSTTKPLILMGASIDDLWGYVQGSETELALWRSLAMRYWPGALTLVLPASDRVPPDVNPTESSTIGIRVPDRAIARHILAQTGPLATTSVNRSGQDPLLSVEAIHEQFPEVLTLSPTTLAELERSLGAGVAPEPAVGVPSTVIRWQGKGWQILRQGSIQLQLD